MPNQDDSEDRAHITQDELLRHALDAAIVAAARAVIAHVDGGEPPTWWAYEQALASVEKHRQRADRAEAAAQDDAAIRADERTAIRAELLELAAWYRTVAGHLQADVLTAAANRIVPSAAAVAAAILTPDADA